MEHNTITAAIIRAVRFFLPLLFILINPPCVSAAKLPVSLVRKTQTNRNTLFILRPEPKMNMPLNYTKHLWQLFRTFNISLKFDSFNRYFSSRCLSGQWAASSLLLPVCCCLQKNRMLTLIQEKSKPRSRGALSECAPGGFGIPCSTQSVELWRTHTV